MPPSSGIGIVRNYPRSGTIAERGAFRKHLIWQPFRVPSIILPSPLIFFLSLKVEGPPCPPNAPPHPSPGAWHRTGGWPRCWPRPRWTGTPSSCARRSSPPPLPGPPPPVVSGPPFPQNPGHRVLSPRFVYSSHASIQESKQQMVQPYNAATLPLLNAMVQYFTQVYHIATSSSDRFGFLCTRLHRISPRTARSSCHNVSTCCPMFLPLSVFLECTRPS